MFAYPRSTAMAATALALSAFALAPAGAQTVSTGTSGTASGQDVTATTCGQGTTDATSVNVSGCAEAEAADGGTVDTSVNAKTNDRRAMQKSTATARDEDERARSRTHTIVRKGETVRSRTMSKYKQRGQRPVITKESSTATQDGTTTKSSGSPPK